MTTTRAPASYWANIARANLAAAKAAREAETAETADERDDDE